MSNYLFVGLICVDKVYIVQWYPSEDSDTRCESKRITVGGNATNSALVFRQLLTKYDPEKETKVYLHSAISDDLLSEKAFNELTPVFASSLGGENPEQKKFRHPFRHKT